jgi:hypothetical protein
MQELAELSAETQDIALSRFRLIESHLEQHRSLGLAITHVQATGGKTNSAVKGSTAAASVALVPGAGLLVPRLSVGSISVKGEFVDSVSGALQLEFIASKNGKSSFVETSSP